MRFAYADPPYLGFGQKYYNDPTYDSLDAHARLIERLSDEFPDGWAYSLTSTTLRVILPLCPEDVRVGSWVKPSCSFKPNVNPAYAWEPVIFRGGRSFERYDDTVRDWLSANIALKKGVVGAKPLRFSYWLFQMLNMKAEDEFVDIFPGSGEVTRAWEIYQHRLSNKVEQLELTAPQ